MKKGSSRRAMALGFLLMLGGAALIFLAFLTFLASGMPADGLSSNHRGVEHIPEYLFFLGSGGLIAGIVVILTKPRTAVKDGRAGSGAVAGDQDGEGQA